VPRPQEPYEALRRPLNHHVASPSHEATVIKPEDRKSSPPPSSDVVPHRVGNNALRSTARQVTTSCCCRKRYPSTYPTPRWLMPSNTRRRRSLRAAERQTSDDPQPLAREQTFSPKVDNPHVAYPVTDLSPSAEAAKDSKPAMPPIEQCL
jgi:hypothetical protein